MGFAGALRRSNLAAIQMRHVERTEKGIRLLLPQAKESQTATAAVQLTFGKTRL